MKGLGFGAGLGLPTTNTPSVLTLSKAGSKKNGTIAYYYTSRITCRFCSPRMSHLALFVVVPCRFVQVVTVCST